MPDDLSGRGGRKAGGRAALGAVCSRLEEAKWEAALTERRAMTFEDAITYALEDAA